MRSEPVIGESILTVTVSDTRRVRGSLDWLVREAVREAFERGQPAVHVERIPYDDHISAVTVVAFPPEAISIVGVYAQDHHLARPGDYEVVRFFLGDGALQDGEAYRDAMRRVMADIRRAALEGGRR